MIFSFNILNSYSVLINNNNNELIFFIILHFIEIKSEDNLR